MKYEVGQLLLVYSFEKTKPVFGCIIGSKNDNGSIIYKAYWDDGPPSEYREEEYYTESMIKIYISQAETGSYETLDKIKTVFPPSSNI